MISQHEINSGYCLACGKEMSGATNPKGEGGPRVGDVSICLYCGHIMEFGIGLILVELSDKTLKEIAGNKDILKMVEIVKMVRIYKNK